MAGSIVEYGLDLDDTWYVLPTTDGAGWAEELAARIVAGTGGDPGLTSLLEQQLRDVRSSAEVYGTGRVQVAVLVDETSPLVTAMLTLTVRADADVDVFRAELDAVADQVEDAQVMGRQDFEGEAPAGPVHGGQFLIGHLQTGLEAGNAHLEERVHAAVFPPGAANAVEVMVVAANVGLFEDLPTTVVDLLQTLSVRVEEAS